MALAPQVVYTLPKEQAREQALSVLAKVGLVHRAWGYPAELSGGERQRVAIARALAVGPGALLGDEVTSALGPELRWEVVDTLRKLKEEGLTMLLVTHEVGLARRLADRVLLLGEGQGVEEGKPETVLADPQTSRAKRFLSKLL